jgi:hypothetical protein
MIVILNLAYVSYANKNSKSIEKYARERNKKKVLIERRTPLLGKPRMSLDVEKENGDGPHVPYFPLAFLRRDFW